MKKLLSTLVIVASAWLVSPAFAETATPNLSVNINTASAAEIAETLQGVGEAKAEAIVAYREEHGQFESPEALSSVSGIGAATVEKNRERISVQ